MLRNKGLQTMDRFSGYGLSTTAMVLAAGLGTRMRPLTVHTPKPLIEVNGRSLIDHVLDRLQSVGIEQAVVNVHYLADLMQAHLARRTAPAIIISDERRELLNSGGGVKKALPYFSQLPFLLANSDTIWIEGARNNVERMLAQWNPQHMDGLLLLAAMTNSVGFDGAGDFSCLPDGRLRRRKEREIVPFAYAGFAILKPELFDGAPDQPFSLNRIFDRALEQDRLYGLRLDGIWMHVGTPEAIRQAEECVARSAA